MTVLRLDPSLVTRENEGREALGWPGRRSRPSFLGVQSVQLQRIAGYDRFASGVVLRDQGNAGAGFSAGE